MKKITFIIMCLTFSFGYGQTILGVGDIAITGVNSRDPDQFSFVLLTDVLSGTTINFTDNGWRNNTVPESFRSGEGTITWTATTDLPCGTEVVITDNENPFTASIGSVTDDSLFALAAGGDHILAYQGTATMPTFLYAIHFANNTGWTNATSSNTSAVPLGLTNGTNAVYVGNLDNAIYDCSVTTDFALILAAVSELAVSGDGANWSGGNGNGNRQTMPSCGFDCSTCSSTVTWDGTSWSATPDLTTEAIINAPYTTDATNGSFSACSLTVNSTLTVADGYYIEVQNDVDGTGDITVETQGNFIQNDDSGTFTVSGTTQVNKITAPASVWYEYTYWGSPVSGANIETALADTNVNRRFIFNAQNFADETYEINNDNGTTTGAGVDDIDDNGDDWELYSTGVMDTGVGYVTTQDAATFTSGRSYNFDGSFNTGTITVPVYRNDTSTADSNWNLLGNPYPSAIEIDAFFTENMYDATTNPTGLLEGVIYFWSHNAPFSATNNGNQGQNFDTTDYAFYNGMGGTVGGDGVTPDGYIPSGQGFFVNYSDDATSNTGNVVFNNAMRSLSLSADNSQFFKESNTKTNSNAVDNKLWINLTSDNGVFNQILTGYIDGATNEYDGSYYDASKIVAPNAYAALYSIIENSDKKFVIQGKATTSLTEAEVIKLGFSTTIDVATLYTLSIANLEGNFLTNNTIYLKDNALNMIHNLSNSDYTFTSGVGEFNERFEVVFSANVLAIETATIEADRFSIISLQNNEVQFNTNSDLQIKTITIFDFLGRQLYSLKGDKSSEIYTLNKLKNMVYIAKIELSNGNIITKKAVKK